MEGYGLSRDEIKTWYRLEYDLRVLYFVDILHSVIIGTIYALAFVMAFTQSAIEAAWLSPMTVAAGGVVCFVIVFVVLPFYFGQSQSLKKCVTAMTRIAAGGKKAPTREALEKELVRTAPLLPTTLPLRTLLIGLTLGGVATPVLGEAFKVLTKMGGGG